MSHHKLSCIIITYNEEDRIVQTIDAVKSFCDEIIVIDSFSTDLTAKVATNAGARVMLRAFEGYGQQKRFAEDQAKNDWVISLDADEVISFELGNEIRQMMNNDSDFAFAGFKLKIYNIYPNWQKPRMFARPDYNNIRLYDKTKIRFRNHATYDSVDAKNEPIGQLKGAVYHFSARSFDHIKEKLEKYSTLQSGKLKKSKLYSVLRLPFEYIFVFIKYSLLRAHILGGIDGLYISHIAASARFKRLIKIIKASV